MSQRTHEAWPAVSTGSLPATTIDDAVVERLFYDRLTGLASRALCINRLEHALSGRMRRADGLGVLALSAAPPSVSTAGVRHAEAVMVELARRLQTGIRAEDTAAYFGDGQFVVLLANIDSVLDATRVAERLAARLGEWIVIGGHRLRPEVRAGVAYSRFCKGSTRVTALVDEAQAALGLVWEASVGSVQVVAMHEHGDDLAPEDPKYA